MNIWWSIFKNIHYFLQKSSSTMEHETQEAASECQTALLRRKGDGTLTQAVQRLCVGSSAAAAQTWAWAPLLWCPCWSRSKTWLTPTSDSYSMNLHWATLCLCMQLTVLAHNSLTSLKSRYLSDDVTPAGLAPQNPTGFPVSKLLLHCQACSSSGMQPAVLQLLILLAIARIFLPSFKADSYFYYETVNFQYYSQNYVT